ncbi:MAG TPA: hypothetical protein VI382_01175 [Candidatus Manganitrophaceae bacterium]|nr:hypothetical protein [Candidatus Manganitrophaceae bacterium]
MKKIIPLALVSVLFGFGLTSCGGGGGSSSSGSTLSSPGFDVPTEISAVPTNLSGAVGGLKPGFKSKLFALEAATDPGTDYSAAVTTKFVEENTLEQFDIIEDVMKALAQTRYADAANINQGPYKAMIAWQDEKNGIETKTLEPWVVDSSMIVENGQNVNRVQAWIEENDMGMIRVIKAEFKISASATKKSDGSYQDYGVWNLNVKFGDTGVSFFAANASIGANGESILKVHENFQEGPFTQQVKAILNKSDTQGFGKVTYPDWSACNQPNCTPSSVTAKYAYNADHLAVQKGTDPVPQFKDRTAVTDMTHRYGMFDSATGADVLKSKSFGFPVQFADANGSHFAYYGAWQGRHQLWADGGSVPAGTVVTRQDRGANQTAETYTVSASFVGTLTKRALVAADISDILNIPVETWINVNMNLLYNGASWIDCQNMTFGGPSPTCGAGSAPVTDFSFLVANPNDRRKFIGINRWDNTSQMNMEYLYDLSGAQGAGFYVATRDQNFNLVSTGTKFTPVTGDQLWVNIGGSIYIEYKGTGATGWVEKKLLNFDERTWTPEFDPAGDVDYTLPLDREYYINNSGANYVVKRTNAGIYDVKIELQTVANPVNASSFLSDPSTRFMVQWGAWGDAGQSTYRFDTTTLKLVYDTIGSNDTQLTNASGQQVQAGDVVTQGQWGLMAYVGGVSAGVQYNWEYPREGETWGTISYLMNADNTYKMLDDPIRLTPITLANNANVSKTLSLQYDGWMGGLPNLYEELRKNNFVMTADISGKIINIPAGTPVTDATDSAKSYLIKPLEVSQFLNIVADPGTLDITVADGVDLTTVPIFVEHNMGAMPSNTVTKYSEGVAVQ